VEPIYGLARAVLFPPLHLGLRWTIEGRHRVPVRGPAILASNHVSYLDPLALAYLADRQHRRVRFLAKAELFDKRGLGGLLRGIHQIPVQRGTADAAGALGAAEAALAAGEIITVFPEGTISTDLEPMPGKTGTARLAAGSGVPVTPVGMWGAHRILTKGRPPRWRAGVAEVVVVGESVLVTSAEPVSVATDRIMGAIAACVARARELYPQQPERGEDRWWVRAPATAATHLGSRVEPVSS